MMRRRLAYLQTRWQKPDWNLLIFLVLFLNVKLVVKLVGLLFLYIRRPVSSFRFSFLPPGIPLFYPAMICIAAINLLWHGLYSSTHYFVAWLWGIGFWTVSILVFCQLSHTVRTQLPEKIHASLVCFFLLNAAVSCIDIAKIIIETGELNPYRYQGNYQEYFIGTGDFIKGISFDTSTTNAILNAIGVVYFLHRKRYAISLLCMGILLLTCSNFTNLLLTGCLLLLFLFRSSRDQKSIIAVQLAMLIAFMTNISPQNNQYTMRAFEKIMGKRRITELQAKPVDIVQLPDSALTVEQKKYKHARSYLDSLLMIKAGKEKLNAASLIVIPKVNIHAPEYQHRPDSSEARMQAISLYNAIKPALQDTTASVRRYAGKMVGWRQLFRFFGDHPGKMIAGDGMGNFSSKLAFRTTGLHMAGGYPASYTYIHPDFRSNHLAVYLDYFVKDTGYHSISNTPNSVYAQLLGEYGLVGLLCFVTGYLGYFLRTKKLRGYGWPLLVLMTGAFFADYWFEQLSVVILFELLLLLNIKENDYAVA